MLKKNSKDVLDIIVAQETRNATQAYKQVHPKASTNSAKSNVYNLLKKPEAQIYMQEHVNKAKSKVVELIDSNKEEIAFKASEAVLNRELGTPTQTIVKQTSGITLTIDLTSALEDEKSAQN